MNIELQENGFKVKESALLKDVKDVDCPAIKDFVGYKFAPAKKIIHVQRTKLLSANVDKQDIDT